jgi:hypothetical protein
MKKMFAILALCVLFTVPTTSYAFDIYAITPDGMDYIQYDLSIVGRVGDNFELQGVVADADPTYSATMFVNLGWMSVVLAGLEDDAWYGHTLTGYTDNMTYISHHDMVPEAGWTVGTTPPPAGAIKVDFRKAR